MSLHHELLEQARHLARRERSKPREASLRRAISAAALALHHLLVHELARAVAPGRDGAPMRPLVAPGVEAERLRRVAKAWTTGAVPPAVRAAAGEDPLPTPLRRFAHTLVTAMEAAERAERDPGSRFTRREAQCHVDDAGEAIARWNDVRSGPAARLFLLALLLWDTWEPGG
ncbi:MAG: hypothetical protein IPM29_19080 [Planctomycetes bacterium]|nr:hypothetical protein [Planctomycetota bacterium]